MAFNSLAFVLFFVIVALLYFIIPYKFRWFILSVASYYFYMCSKPEYVVIILFTTCVSYYCAIKMNTQKNRKKKFILILAITINLGCLFLFKYLNFFDNSIIVLLKQFHLSYNVPELKWIVPLGISFYTLQTLSYLIDVYREEIAPERHFGYFALYVSFFPTILSGPIERGKHLLPQLHKRHDFNYDRVVEGMLLVFWGVFKKVVIADRIGNYVNLVYGNVHAYKGWTLIVATFFFGIQLYCDFSGYTDIAIGCAKILGYDLIKNFNLPYFSQSIQEFWRRWHISLSTWFKDYLYIPLGGNRVSKSREYFNLTMVFLICGIWHGANWTFVIWGGIHGLYQIVGKGTKKIRANIIKILHINSDGIFLKIYKILITFCLVNFAWIFFRAKNLNDAIYIVENMFTGLTVIHRKNITLGVQDFKIMVFAIMVLIIVELIDFIKNSFFLFRIRKKPLVIRWVIYYIFIMIIMLIGYFGSGTFIYSKF